ncbi:hypothetical protein FD754_020935 [Muntiacus muntjak]|uniref:Ig-like domain-containing protein n=1 Tax=Muntiacus muntjak TaxID=9888 RepID=A0A5N3V4P9_MUNMU|nr:hypothetical protein FD754_020935 [Muntiacus muntjak]
MVSEIQKGFFSVVSLLVKYTAGAGFFLPPSHLVWTIKREGALEAILACKYPKKTVSSRLEWKKLGRSVSFVYYQQALQGDFKDRAEMIDFSIRIKNVTRNDAGKYRCEVSAPSEQGQNLEEDTVTLEVLVAPAVPSCEVPSSALRGTVVELRCQDKEGNPAPEYTWFKNGVPLLENPKLGSQITNSSYTMNPKSGTLQFNTVSKLDSGEYSCEARNSVGHRRCPGKRMQVDDLNISGIIAAVVIVALVISVCGLGVCYAQRKGYFSSKCKLISSFMIKISLETICEIILFANKLYNLSDNRELLKYTFLMHAFPHINCFFVNHPFKFKSGKLGYL